MRRRTFLAGLGSVLAAPLAAGAQEAAKVARIGVLAPRESPNTDAFRQGLSDQGHVEGRTITLEYRWDESRPERLAALAADLVRLKVDVILAPGTAAALAAKQATRDTPIVFAVVADPIASGLVQSLAKPGGNITGLTTINRELQGKRLDLLREIVPRMARLALLYSPSDPSNVAGLGPVKDPAHALGITLHSIGVRTATDVNAAFATIRSERTHALMVSSSPFLTPLYRRVAELAMQNRVPAIYSNRNAVELGGLMAYAAAFTEQHRRAALFVDKILKGAKPGELPIEQPTKFELVINLKTAKALGLTIPQSLLLRADQVIQ